MRSGSARLGASSSIVSGDGGVVRRSAENELIVIGMIASLFRKGQQELKPVEPIFQIARSGMSTVVNCGWCLGAEAMPWSMCRSTNRC